MADGAITIAVDDEMHLPWERTSLEALMRKVLSTGETNKVDLKGAFGIVDAQQQGEFLKDVAAIANTYNHNYRNHGFLVFGVQQNAIAGCTFADNEDHLQASIDDLIKKYLSPFITTHLFIFTDGIKRWGVLVIPPTWNAPHIFINDTHKRHRGDIYVRSGTTTVKAQPEDYARFFRQHLEEHTYKFQQSISDLQRQVVRLEQQVKKVQQQPAAASKTTKGVIEEPSIVPESSSVIPPKSITEKIDALLAKEDNQVMEGLLEEARKINTFLESDEIPWIARQSDKDATKAMFTKIEEVSGEFWSAVTSLILKDDKGTYDNALLKALGYLARDPSPPQGTYTHAGKNIRYLPLFVALYLITICAVAKKRDKLLNKVFKVQLQGRTHYDEPLPITYLLFSIRNSADLFQPLYEGFPQRRWCDPIATYTRSLIDRILNPDDPLWNKTGEFFKGEFVLCISPMGIVEKETNKPMIGHPSSGLFLFLHESEPILIRFLKNEKDWLKKIFDRPLDKILAEFDENAHKLVDGAGLFCGNGFERGAVNAAFPEKTKQTQTLA